MHWFPCMARIPREAILQNKSYFHVTWKCHNHDFLLRDEGVKEKLYELLRQYKKKFNIRIFGYCFMSNHPHLVGYCESVQEFSRFFQVVNSTLARYINRRLERSGQVVMDRLRSPQIQSPKHLMHTLHYVTNNPVRAGICRDPSQYRWSSYRTHAFGIKDPLLDPLPEGLQIDVKVFRKLNRVLLRTQQKTNFFTKTYFFGSPAWVRKKQKDLQLFLLAREARLSAQREQECKT